MQTFQQPFAAAFVVTLELAFLALALSELL